VADDGSTDVPLDILTDIAWHFPWYYCYQQHRGVRIGQARNLGARLAKGTGFVLIDSDVLLNPHALSHYNNLHLANPTCILIGRYDWLPPMQITMQDVQFHWEDVVEQHTCPPLASAEGAASGIQGPDPRYVSENQFKSDRVNYDYCLAMFSGNLLIPRMVWEPLGGFDEEMVGHGGEDCEFAMRAQEAHIPAIFSDKVIGYHVWHPRNQAKNEREVRVNLDYIAKKHDLAALGIRRGDIKSGELPLVLEEP
jgi:GT2 family glycosyltransferase